MKTITKRELAFGLIGLVLISLVVALYPGVGPFHQVLYADEINGRNGDVVMLAPFATEELLIRNAATLGGETRSTWPEGEATFASCVEVIAYADELYVPFETSIFIDDLPCRVEQTDAFGKGHIAVDHIWPELHSNLTERLCKFSYDFTVFTGQDYFDQEGMVADNSFNYTQLGTGTLFIREMDQYLGNDQHGYALTNLFRTRAEAVFIVNSNYTNIYQGAAWSFPQEPTYGTGFLYQQQAFLDGDPDLPLPSTYEEWNGFYRSYLSYPAGNPYGNNWGIDSGECNIKLFSDEDHQRGITLEATTARYKIEGNVLVPYPVQCKLRFCG
ncbi:MAG: hypothetical protein H6502_03320 [Candidatus Woesearchaeota archaeon]|nr:MAG: hypothetical protein H6502_03320 [Candidatus Woesearchaeota archaeon]